MRLLQRVAGLTALLVAVALGSATRSSASTPTRTTANHAFLNCAVTRMCTDVADSDEVFGTYVGHDKPSLLFYSNTPGAGNANTYHMILPSEPPTPPQQNGTGGTPSFMLHPAFWYGMAMCDTFSDPNVSSSCTPNSDGNIFDNANPAAPDFIGNHPGAAFMEMQFYPPGWGFWPNTTGNSCSPTQWCAALNIDSLSRKPSTRQNNNASCLAQVGLEPVNFAFITKNGNAHAPANPLLSTIGTFTPSPVTDLFMNPGDEIVTSMFDTSAGFTVSIQDLTTGQHGSMVASANNTFGHIVFDPAAGTCTSQPYTFHPMYSTSSEHTRVPWAAHSYNVAFSDEIGHFERCSDTACVNPGGVDDGGIADADDINCTPGSQSLLYNIGGCTFTDGDFDGPTYGNNWPGTIANPATDASLHSSPIKFSSPTFGLNSTFDRVAFEADMPAIENYCNIFTGAGCTNPPNGPGGPVFYPIYTTGTSGPDALQTNGCLWQLGGRFLPNTTNTFGGTSTTEYGAIAFDTHISGAGSVQVALNNRQILGFNPCQPVASRPFAVTQCLMANLASGRNPSYVNGNAGQNVTFVVSAQCPLAQSEIITFYINGVAIQSSTSMFLIWNTAGHAPGNYTVVATVQRTDTGATITTNTITEQVLQWNYPFPIPQ